MTFVPTVMTASASAAAARHAAMLRREEEDMTPYRGEETEGWEFKIVRSLGKFKRPAVVQQLVQEEAVAGWELLEKFDDSRIRFKRRIEHRASDSQRSGDPYRTHYGMSQNKVALLAVLVVLAVGLVAGLLVYLESV